MTAMDPLGNGAAISPYRRFSRTEWASSARRHAADLDAR